MSAQERLVASLAAAMESLEAGDPLAASRTLDAAVAACEELSAAGIRLDPATLAHARAVHAGCAAAALEAQRDLDARMDAAAGARRAVGAYQR